MAKEKYIFAFEVETNEDLYNNFTPCIGCDCSYCEDECLTHKKPMPRQEVIECMAKAMCVRDNGISCDECIYKNSNNCKTTLENWFIEDAEAALNAIVSIIPREEDNG